MTDLFIPEPIVITPSPDALRAAVERINRNLSALDQSIAELSVLSGVPCSHVPITFDGGNVAIVAGDWDCWYVAPFSGQVSGWYLLADAYALAGSFCLDVLKSSWADGFPVSSSICGSNYPEMTNSRQASDELLIGWTKTFSKGDIFSFPVRSCVNVRRASLYMILTPTAE